ncbi:MAG: hypothetical protein AAF960_19685 [Bacteroidota bacterium]
MKNVVLFLTVMGLFLVQPILGQQIGNLTIERQITFIERLSNGHSSLLVESLVIEVTLLEMTASQLEEAIEFASQMNFIPLLEDTFAEQLHPDLSQNRQLAESSPVLLEEKFSDRVNVIPIRLHIPITSQNRLASFGRAYSF